MREIIVTGAEQGERLDKLLSRYLNLAPKSFLYRMLRKKNIELNGKKAAGNERLSAGDQVCLFLAEETIEKFRQSASFSVSGERTTDTFFTASETGSETPVVLYEDEHVLFVNKPAGMLTQKAQKTDLSLNDWILSRLLSDGTVTKEQLQRFRPSVCNRLDRNTSGLVAAGKTITGLAGLSELIRDRRVHKYYYAIVAGYVQEPATLDGYLKKDPDSNQVRIYTHPQEGADYIRTCYRPVAAQSRLSLLKIELITGKTHQIRAHLASVGHPIAGDSKYGDVQLNRRLAKQYQVNRQLLHAEEMVFPTLSGPLSGLSERRIKAPLPPDFCRVAQAEGLK